MPVAPTIALLLLLVLLLSGSPALGLTTLRMLGPEDVGGAWAEVIRRFEARNPGIKVQYISGPWSTDERQNMYIRSFLGKDPFELVYMDVIWTAKFASEGWLLPLEGWLPPERWEEFLPGDIQAGLYDGHLWRVPVRSDAGMLYYRKDLVKEPPRTWAELEATCRALARPPELYCMVFQGMQYEGLVCNYLEHLWGAGGQVITPEEEVALLSEENIRALGFMRRLLQQGFAPRGVITFQEQHSLEFFQAGRALFMRNWPYAWRLLQDSPLRGKVGIVPMVHAPGGRPAATLGGWGLGIAKGAKDPEAAWRFIEFATSEEAQRILHERRGAVPSRRALFEDPEILRRNPHYGNLYQVLLSARPRPVHPEYPRISAILQKHASAVLVGIESPQEAAGHMHRAIEGLLKGRKASWPRRLLLDYDLHRTLLNTVLFTALSVPPEFLLGLLMALLVNAPLRGRNLGRLGVLIPWALPTAVMAMAWQWMFSNPFGVINDLLVRAGLLSAPLDWLSSPAGAMFAAVFADVWKTTPFVSIILLAGLQAVPRELKESFQMEGAGAAKQFLHLTLPLLMPYIRVALIFRLIHAAGIFDLIWVLTKGGPADSTRTLSLYIYDLAFRYGELPYALWLTALFLLALMLLSVIILRVLTLRYERVF
jgi:multiple sugar transport system substrate-binding protein